MVKLKYNLKDFSGDLFGGLAAMLVALPSGIAFGLIIYSGLGSQYSGRGAMGGIIGCVLLGLLAPLFGGTSRLISAPCAPAAGVLAAFVTDLTAKGVAIPEIPILITLVALLCGILQLIAGFFKGGNFIKYIPYPVVAGYLSGVGVIIILGQLPKFMGLAKGVKLAEGIMAPATWSPVGISIGVVTIGIMLFAPYLTQKVPAAIVALAGGILTYAGLALCLPELATLEGNSYVIGSISAGTTNFFDLFLGQLHSMTSINGATLQLIVVPAITLAVLLSVDTLKTCVVLDALTMSRHDSNRELLGQGIGNLFSALFCGVSGAGTMGATLVNISSGGRTKFSGVIMGIFSLLVLLFLGRVVAWIPVASLAGILLVVGYRMIDKKSFDLLKHHSTTFDFIVIISVIVAAVSLSLIAAAGVGIALAIVLFLRDHIRRSVIRRKIFGNQTYSKKKRIQSELKVLQEYGKNTVICELQGQLFFGTTDQLFSELEHMLPDCTYLIFDLRRVQSVDFTAVHLLHQLQMRMAEKQGFLILSSVTGDTATGQNIRKYLQDLGIREEHKHVFYFSSLDDALEWVEDRILEEKAGPGLRHEKILNLAEIEFFQDISAPHLALLNTYLQEKTYQPGEIIFQKDAQGSEILFIRSGLVKISLPLGAGLTHHIATFGRGDFFGDMSFLDRQTRSANAEAMEETCLYILSKEDFNTLSRELPELAGKIYERLAYMLALRLRHTDIELEALQKA